MSTCRRQLLFAVIAFSLGAGAVRSQEASADGKQTDSSKIAADGTAYVTRVVPVPGTISPEAQKMLARVVSDAAVPQTLEQRREWFAQFAETGRHRLLVAEDGGEIVASVDVVLRVPGELIALVEVHPRAGIMGKCAQHHPAAIQHVVHVDREVVGKDRP